MRNGFKQNVVYVAAHHFNLWRVASRSSRRHQLNAQQGSTCTVTASGNLRLARRHDTTINSVQDSPIGQSVGERYRRDGAMVMGRALSRRRCRTCAACRDNDTGICLGARGSACWRSDAAGAVSATVATRTSADAYRGTGAYTCTAIRGNGAVAFVLQHVIRACVIVAAYYGIRSTYPLACGARRQPPAGFTACAG